MQENISQDHTVGAEHVQYLKSKCYCWLWGDSGSLNSAPTVKWMVWNKPAALHSRVHVSAAFLACHEIGCTLLMRGAQKTNLHAKPFLSLRPSHGYKGACKEEWGEDLCLLLTRESLECEEPARTNWQLLLPLCVYSRGRAAVAHAFSRIWVTLVSGRHGSISPGSSPPGPWVGESVHIHSLGRNLLLDWLLSGWNWLLFSSWNHHFWFGGETFKACTLLAFPRSVEIPLVETECLHVALVCHFRRGLS